MLTVAALVSKAESAIGLGTEYKLSMGGVNPHHPRPGGDPNQCDCSGFICWCLGVSRMTDIPLYKKFNGGWINTDAMVADAKASTGIFTELEQPAVGAFIVYPKHDGLQYGHVGLVTEVANGKVASVIHCSSGNFKKHGDAILETGPEAFDKLKTIYAWYDGLI